MTEQPLPDEKDTHDLPNVKDKQEDGDPANMGGEDKEEDITDDACITIDWPANSVCEAKNEKNVDPASEPAT